jgi:hypothetical protein
MKMKIERCMADTYPVSMSDEHEVEGLSEDRNKNQGEQGVSSIVPSCHGTFSLQVMVQGTRQWRK